LGSPRRRLPMLQLLFLLGLGLFVMALLIAFVFACERV
jgi:hypothetical protein